MILRHFVMATKCTGEGSVASGLIVINCLKTLKEGIFTHVLYCRYNTKKISIWIFPFISILNIIGILNTQPSKQLQMMRPFHKLEEKLIKSEVAPKI